MRRTHLVGLLMMLNVALAGCHSKPKAPPPMGQRIAEAHGLEFWQNKGCIAGDLHIEVGNQPALDMTFIYEIKTGRTRMRLADDTLLVFDGQDAWVSPPAATTQKVRYTLRAWPWLVVAPLRLAEGGITLGEIQDRELGGQPCPSAKLSFAPGVRDYAQDWSIVYADPKTWQLRGMTFLLTDGRPVAEAEDSPHAVTYYNYKMVEGVVLGAEWKLWRWNKAAGIHGQPIGSARVYNLEFYEPKKGTFNIPAGARKAE